MRSRRSTHAASVESPTGAAGVLPAPRLLRFISSCLCWKYEVLNVARSCEGKSVMDHNNILQLVFCLC